MAALDPDNGGVLIVQLKRGGAGVNRVRKHRVSLQGGGDPTRKLDLRSNGYIAVM